MLSPGDGGGGIVSHLNSLSQLPGWLGTLVIRPDGSVQQSSGGAEGIAAESTALHFAAIANRIGRLMTLEQHRHTAQFERLTGQSIVLPPFFTPVPHKAFNAFKNAFQN